MDSKKYFYEFGKTFYKIDGFYAEYAKSSGVKENLLWVLYALNDGEKHSQKEICDNWDLPRTTINTIIKELENNGHVELSQIQGEKRELNVSLTEKGKLYANEILKDLYELEEKVFEEIKGLHLLENMNELLNKLNERRNRND